MSFVDSGHLSLAHVVDSNRRICADSVIHLQLRIHVQVESKANHCVLFCKNFELDAILVGMRTHNDNSLRKPLRVSWDPDLHS